MTCYSFVKSEADRKRRLDEERRRQKELAEKLAARKLLLPIPSPKPASHASDWRESQREALEKKRKEDAARRRAQEEERRKRAQEKLREARLQAHSVGQKALRRRAKPVPGIQHKAGAKTALHAPKKPDSSGSRPASLSLEARQGLPVSLSAGQKNVFVVLMGKNASQKPVQAGLLVSIFDSKKNPIIPKIDPKECSIPAQGTAQFSVSFDISDSIPTGPLVLGAFLKENAFYLDSDSGKSSSLSLSSQVKTSLDLEYVRGSFKFANGEIRAEFLNRGQSGGVLGTKSSVLYGSGGRFSRAPLSKKTKIKGLERRAVLVFAPASRVAAKRLAFELVGVDSNGKPYRAKKEIAEEGI